MFDWRDWTVKQLVKSSIPQVFRSLFNRIVNRTPKTMSFVVTASGTTMGTTCSIHQLHTWIGFDCWLDFRHNGRYTIAVLALQHRDSKNVCVHLTRFFWFVFYFGSVTFGTNKTVYRIVYVMPTCKRCMYTSCSSSSPSLSTMGKIWETNKGSRKQWRWHQVPEPTLWRSMMKRLSKLALKWEARRVVLIFV